MRTTSKLKGTLVQNKSKLERICPGNLIQVIILWTKKLKRGGGQGCSGKGAIVAIIAR